MGRPILPGKERQEKGRRVLPSRILCRAGGRGGLEPAGHSAHFPNNVASRWVLQPPWKHGRIAQRLGGAGSPRSLRLRHDVLVREIDARTADLGSVSFDGQKAGCPENNLTTGRYLVRLHSQIALRYEKDIDRRRRGGSVSDRCWMHARERMAASFCLLSVSDRWMTCP